MNSKIGTAINESYIVPLSEKLNQWEYNLKRGIHKFLNIDLYGKMLSAKRGNLLIAEQLKSEQPLMISRFGSSEMGCVLQYLSEKQEYSECVIQNITRNSGFFISDERDLENYSKLFLNSSNSIDILGVWFLRGEAKVIRNCCAEASFVKLSTLEPYYHEDPWSQYLKGKKVLVIHPFAETISKQYKNHRKFIFNNPNMLPEFQLRTLKAVQSIGGNNTEFDSWFDAYHWMQNRIKEHDFDIAIIGCGAYGLPLAAYVKSLGKKAIHLGGATQILFGIKGKRWDEKQFFQSLYNEYWVRPSSEEIPQGHLTVEDGCYW